MFQLLQLVEYNKKYTSADYPHPQLKFLQTSASSTDTENSRGSASVEGYICNLHTSVFSTL